ncbi:MAG TPA: zinc ribbon domain-containing protein [Thermoplasmata archaeon]|nr:zinc ribbon domain-containing protein [Thermoplasmata archaeon]
MEQRGTVKSFVARPLGRLLLVAVATATLVGSFLYLGPLLAIPTLLFFGLAMPIYLGWKRPRHLALVGLAALLIAAPVGSLWEAQLIRAPSPAANSDAVLPYGNGGAVLQDAKVTPFAGASGGVFNFSVTVHPEFTPTNTSGLLWVEVFVTTCPGATGNASPNCPSGYPFYTANQTLGPNLTSPFVSSFKETLPGANLWWFQFATAYRATPTSNYTWIFLDPGNGYGAVQGPISGDYYSTVGLIIPNFYLVMFLYPGSVFFIGLLIYYIFKRREAARKAEAAAGAPPPTAPLERPKGPTPGTTSGAPASGSAPEKRCPNCNAVVYPNEATCWKCGQSLTAAPTSDAPLTGGKAQ